MDDLPKYRATSRWQACRVRFPAGDLRQKHKCVTCIVVRQPGAEPAPFKFVQPKEITMSTKELPLDKIRIDGNTQPRVKLDNATVAEYAEQMAAGVEFPDAVVFHDGTDHWLSAGFHRYFASKKAELLTINCDVRKGTLQDARDFATSSNTDHGLKRTNEDKRKQVGMTLEDHPDWADRKIAEHCCVGHPLVADVRSQLEEIPVETTSKRTGKDGKKRTVPPKPAPVVAKLVLEKIEANGVKHSTAEMERLAELTPQQQRAVVDSVISGDAKTIGGAMGSVEPSPVQSSASIVLDAIKRPIPKHLTEKHGLAASIQSAATKLDAVKHTLEMLVGEPGAEFLQFSPVFESLKDLKKQISDARYWSECPRCQGKVNEKCDRCDGHGYLPFSRKGQLSAEDKAYLGVE